MSKTIEVEIKVEKSINTVQNIVKHGSNPYITLALDTHYEECIEHKDVPTQPIEPLVNMYCHATTKASGTCAFKDSKFGLYVYDNKGNKIGYVHFFEKNSGVWHAGDSGVDIQATANQPGYVFAVRTGDDIGTTNHFTLTISGEAATGQ